MPMSAWCEHPWHMQTISTSTCHCVESPSTTLHVHMHQSSLDYSKCLLTFCSHSILRQSNSILRICFPLQDARIDLVVTNFSRRKICLTIIIHMSFAGICSLYASASASSTKAPYLFTSSPIFEEFFELGQIRSFSSPFLSFFSKLVLVSSPWQNHRFRGL